MLTMFLTRGQAVGWVVGFVMGDFTFTLMGWAAGVVISIIVSPRIYDVSISN